MSEITLRRLSSATVHDYRTIRLEALQQAPEAFGSSYEVEVARPIGAFEQRVATSVVYGAYCGDQIVGVTGLAAGSGPKDSHKGFLWGMYVRSDARRQGVGAALIEAVVQHAPDEIEQITLAVVQSNKAARALHARLGFTTYGVEPKALKTQSGYLDEILMVKFLRTPLRASSRRMS